MNTPVSFEIAKLLKEKEFEGNYFYYWNMVNHSGEWKLDTRIWEYTDDYIEAPIIAEVVMWILKKYKIWISADCGKEFWMFRIRFTDNTKIVDFQLPDGLQSALTGLIFSNTKYLKYNTPAEAYLAGIKYVLTDLIYKFK